MVVLMIPLMFFPRFLLILSDFEVPLTPLERFLSHQLGILLVALAAGTVMAVSIRRHITGPTQILHRRQMEQLYHLTLPHHLCIHYWCLYPSLHP
jgi:hypothetical protein